MKFQKVIIIGGTSGIGAEIARQLEQAGSKVAVVGRTSVSYPHDVKNLDEIPALFQKITDDLGGLDLIIYSSGVLIKPELDEYPTALDVEEIAVNLTGAVAWLNVAATRFTGVRHGTIVALGSVAGDRGRRMMPVYHATKAGLATYMESLRNRLSQYGVAVTTIKPGPVATPMIDGLGMPNAMPVEKAAAIIIRRAGCGREIYLSPIHAIVFAVLRNIPSFIFRRLKL